MWELDYKESWALKNWCFWTVVLEKTLESPLDCKEIQPVHPKGDQSWIFFGRTDAELETPNTSATWCKELTHLNRPWCWERLRAGGEGDNRGWDGLMASPTKWTWVWVNSGSWWWTGRPGVLRFTGSQRIRHSWVNELNWTTCTSQASKTLTLNLWLPLKPWLRVEMSRKPNPCSPLVSRLYQLQFYLPVPAQIMGRTQAFRPPWMVSRGLATGAFLSVLAPRSYSYSNLKYTIYWGSTPSHYISPNSLPYLNHTPSFSALQICICI